MSSKSLIHGNLRITAQNGLVELTLVTVGPKGPTALFMASEIANLVKTLTRFAAEAKPKVAPVEDDDEDEDIL
jgi:hypothetical protein